MQKFSRKINSIGKRLAKSRAAWLAPVFASYCFCLKYPVPGAQVVGLACALRLSRSTRWPMLIPLFAAIFLGCVVSTQGVTEGGAVFDAGAALFVSAVQTLPILADKALVSHFGLLSSPSILSFAMLCSAIFHAASLVNPLGIAGIPGAELVWKSPLAQLLCAFGLPGAYFLTGWSASLASVLPSALRPNAIKRFAARSIRNHTIAWIAFVLCLLMISSAAAMALPSNSATNPSRSVRIGGIVVGSSDDGKPVSESQLDAIFNATEGAARAGARLLVWSEYALGVDTFPGDASDDGGSCRSGKCRLSTRLRETAARLGAYIQASAIVNVYEFPGLEASNGTAKQTTSYNEILLFSPKSDAPLYVYDKSHPIIGLEIGIEAGPGRAARVDTEYGRVGAVVCIDLAYPQLVSQLGRASVDIMLVPSDDWKPVYRFLTYTLSLRAVENGAALARVTFNGRSAVFDPLGSLIFEDSAHSFI